MKFLFVLLAALIIRFYNFPEWFGFDYDQEINAWFAKAVVVDHKPILIGPETSVGGMYVGPYFNYIIALFYFLGRMDPAVTVVLNFLLSIATISFVYFVGRKVFSPLAGLSAALIYGLSYNLTNFDRVLWNPTPIPLVSLGTLFFLYRYLIERKRWQLAVAFVFAGFMFHLHFSAIFLAAFLGIALVLFGGRRFWGDYRNYLIGAGMLLFFFFPLIAFDFRHEFLNFSHLRDFFFNRGAVGEGNFLSGVMKMIGIFVGFTRAVFYNGESRILDIFAGVGFLFVVHSKLFHRLAFLLFALPIVGLSLYKGVLPAHYLLFTLPVIVLLFGDFFARVAVVNRWGKALVLVVLPLFLFANIPQILRSQSGLSLKYKDEAVKYVAADAKEASFKVDFITEPGRKTGFRYLFWLRRRELIEDMSKQTEKAYKIIVPYFLVPEKDLAARFGGVGVIKMSNGQ